ncbi:DnaJ sub C member 7 [Savitreella phatthalungensis]
MSVPWRDPATGKVSTRQRTVWTTLPHAFEFKNQYNSSDGPTQVYAGFELFESQVASLLPIDPSHFVKSTFIRKAASFEMTQTFAAEKTQARVSEHEAEVARQVLQREYGALVRLHDFQVEVLFDAVKKLLMPVYIFPGAPSPTIVSGLTGRAAGVVIHDPGLTAALAAGTIGTVFIFALGFPVFGTLIATISYFGVRTAMRWLPVWRLARLEGARQSDRTKNASMSNVGHNGLGSRQGPYNPFNTGFFGDLFTGKRSNWDYFDPFRSAGDFSGPRRPADPFYGYGRTGHGSQQEQQQEQYKTRHAGDGQGTYDQYQRETASRGPRAARHHDPKGYYKVLGVMPGARKEEIQSAFRKLALSKHPDKFPPEQRASATKEFSRITEAYQVLRNDGRRRSYDTNGQ